MPLHGDGRPYTVEELKQEMPSAEHYGISDEVWQELAPYENQVAKPVYGFGDFLTGRWAQKQQQYAQDLMDRKANADALQSARVYENTAIQRQVEDMKRAGLNPYWMMSSGSVQGATSASESKNTYKSHGSSAQSNDMAKTLMNLAKTIAVFALIYG